MVSQNMDYFLKASWQDEYMEPKGMEMWEKKNEPLVLFPNLLNANIHSIKKKGDTLLPFLLSKRRMCDYHHPWRAEFDSQQRMRFHTFVTIPIQIDTEKQLLIQQSF